MGYLALYCAHTITPVPLFCRIGLWKTVTLKELIEALDALGYDCYFEGTPTITRITGCWVDEYEFKNWCVCVCVVMYDCVHNAM